MIRKSAGDMGWIVCHPFVQTSNPSRTSRFDSEWSVVSDVFNFLHSFLVMICILEIIYGKALGRSFVLSAAASAIFVFPSVLKENNTLGDEALVMARVITKAWPRGRLTWVDKNCGHDSFFTVWTRLSSLSKTFR